MREMVLDPRRDALGGLTRLTAAESGAGDSQAAERAAEMETRLRECGPLAYRVARGVLRNDADAEDVAQEALLRAFQRFDRLREPQRFRGWLVRIAFRIALDRMRSAKRRALRETEWMHASGATANGVPARAEFQRRLEAALAELPDKLRMVLLLAAMEGHSLEEVSALLGIPMGTVKSRLFFARKKLAERLR